MADFCSNCENIFDIDLVAITDEMAVGETVGIGICENCGIRAISKIARNQYEGLFIVDDKENWKRLHKIKKPNGLPGWFLSAVGLD